MPKLNPFPGQAAEQRENWRVVNDAIEQSLLKYWLIPGEAALVSVTLGFTGPAGGTVPALLCPDADKPEMQWTVPLSPQVGPSVARITFWYTSPTASAANISLLWEVRAFRPAAAMSTNTLIGTTGSVNYPGPAAAYTEKVGGPFVLATAKFREGGHHFLRVLHTRDVADASTAQYDYILGLLEMLPT